MHARTIVLLLSALIASGASVSPSRADELADQARSTAYVSRMLWLCGHPGISVEVVHSYRQWMKRRHPEQLVDEVFRGLAASSIAPADAAYGRNPRQACARAYDGARRRGFGP